MAKKIKVIENGLVETESGYTKVEQWNQDNVKEVADYYRKILGLLGEDPGREGLLKTPKGLPRRFIS